MDTINKQNSVKGYIKGGFIVLHHMDYDHDEEDENGKAVGVKVPKLCAFNPHYITNIRNEHYYGGTVVECTNEGYSHICESVEEILELLEEFKNKDKIKFV